MGGGGQGGRGGGDDSEGAGRSGEAVNLAGGDRRDSRLDAELLEGDWREIGGRLEGDWREIRGRVSRVGMVSIAIVSRAILS